VLRHRRQPVEKYLINHPEGLFGATGTPQSPFPESASFFGGTLAIPIIPCDWLKYVPGGSRKLLTACG